MTTARKNLVDSEHRLVYHIISVCVRNSFLCGKDRRTRKDYSHRKQWIIDRIHQLAPCFSLNVEAYAIMSNHFHLVVDFDPKGTLAWSDETVVERWLNACPGLIKDPSDEQARLELKQRLMLDAKEIARIRGKLASLSTFMQLLKQPISRDANKEDGCTGHFFEQRFWSGAVLDQAALIASMAYVDLNPVRANLANTIEACEHTSICERLTVQPLTAEILAQVMKPIVGGLPDSKVRITLGAYLDRLRVLVANPTPKSTKAHDQQQRWMQQVASLGKRQRVYGPERLVHQWLDTRHMRHLEAPLPE